MGLLPKQLRLIALFATFSKVLSSLSFPSIEQEARDFAQIVVNGMNDALRFPYPTDARQYAESTNCWHWLPFCNLPAVYGVYDYIVIGSGSAGSVIASRLSERANLSIVLLEAGDFENDFIDIPSMSFFAEGTPYNWQYTSTPQTGCCLGMVEQRCLFQRGRGIGGTTLINHVVYSRASANDYNRWSQLENPGWSYEEVLPYFIRSEDSHIDGDKGFHGTGGYLNVEYTNYTNPHLEAFLDAAVELNYTILDYNGREHLGVSRAQFNTLHGRRLSTGRAFLFPVLNRPNLNISPNSYVTRILINDFSKAAYGVEFVRNHRRYVVYARNEVILSAGTIGSPHILMNSGVGPGTHLQQMGIPLVSDLSVGDNLQDHISIMGLSILSNTSIDILSIEDESRLYLEGQGSYTLPGNNHALGFFKTNFSRYDSADFELLQLSPNRTDAYYQRGFGYTNETFHALTENITNPSTFTIYIYALHPDSRGTVRLRSNNPFDYPVIDPRFLLDEDNYDIETLYYGIDLVQKLLNASAYRRLDARINLVDLPACRNHELGSRDYWYCFIRQTGDEIYHPVGTCRMGPDPKLGAVVDSKLKVHGVRNLRVADASVIPFSMVGHTSAPTMMIGERLADFILKGN